MRRVHAAGLSARLAADDHERGMVRGADPSGVDLAERANSHGERDLQPLLVARREAPQRLVDVGRERLDFEPNGLALQLGEGDDGVTSRTPRVRVAW